MQASALDVSELSESLRVNGFMTFGGSTVDREGVFFKAYKSQPDGATKGQVDWETNSLIGLQVEYDFTDKLGITLQGVSRKNRNGNFSPDLAWAYLTYHTDEYLDIRLGRFLLPLYRNSELQFINYTRTWAINPYISEFAGGFSQFEGLDLLYQRYIGDYELTARTSYGEANEDFNGGPVENFNSNDIKSASLQLEKNQYRFSLGYIHSHLEYTGTVRGPRSETIDQILAQGGSFEFQIPLYQIVASGGFGMSSFSKNLPDSNFGYLSLAYPYKSFTPYLLYSIDTITLNRREQNQPELELKDETYSMGLRYDLDANIALKGQIDHIKPRNFPDRNQNDETVDSYNAFTIILDMVF